MKISLPTLKNFGAALAGVAAVATFIWVIWSDTSRPDLDVEFLDTPPVSDITLVPNVVVPDPFHAPNDYELKLIRISNRGRDIAPAPITFQVDLTGHRRTFFAIAISNVRADNPLSANWVEEQLYDDNRQEWKKNPSTWIVRYQANMPPDHSIDILVGITPGFEGSASSQLKDRVCVTFVGKSSAGSDSKCSEL